MKNAARALAVIDGGKFDDVARLLLEAGLSGRPLYLEGGDPAARAAAGHLVPLYEPRDLRAAIALGREPGAPVIWSWPKGEMALYRHLRTLNLVKIPNEARAEAEAAGEDVSGMPACETVLFRHWDPNVLGTLLPLLDGPQQARFLGAATGLAFEVTYLGRLMAVPRPAGLPAAAPGMLRFPPEQMAGMQHQREAVMAVRVADYLATYANEPSIRLGAAGLAAFCQSTVAEAVALGIEQEGAHCRWAYLQLMTRGRVLDAPGVREMFQDSTVDITPDDRVRILFDTIVAMETPS
jgi:hypothetical protein